MPGPTEEPRPLALSELSWPVDVGAMFDGYDADLAIVVIYAVDHPVIAAAGAVKTLQAEHQRLADPARVLGKRAGRARSGPRGLRCQGSGTSSIPSETMRAA